ncbi:MAG: sugar phosphate nucleotidyltransferase [Thermomicrobiales bacterium]|nr:sugar phosphate nucleotidyltransferase [Thermomicrobiales bacterium]
MDIILPVAGLGTRLRPQTWSKPKPLVSVAGRPMLSHVLDRVMLLEPRRLIFITGYLGNQIESWVEAEYQTEARFIEQPVMLGQTDAIIRAREAADQDALILFPDMLFEADFSVIESSDADVIAFVKEVPDPSAYGIAVEEDGRVVRLVEKPQNPESNLAVVGIYYVRNMEDLYSAIVEQFERKIALKNEYFLADAVQIMIDRGKKVVTAPVTVWEDCGNDAALLQTNRYLLGIISDGDPAIHGSGVIEPSFIHPTARIEESVVGPYASIGPDAVITRSIVRDTIVDQGAKVEGAILDYSIVGKDATVTGHAVSVNVGDTSTVRI